MGQQKQMATFCRIELERPGQVLEKRHRYTDIPPCSSQVYLDNPTPASAATLFASKAQCTAPAARRQANLLSRNAFTAAAQEVRKLGAVSFELRGAVIR